MNPNKKYQKKQEIRFSFIHLLLLKKSQKRRIAECNLEKKVQQVMPVIHKTNKR